MKKTNIRVNHFFVIEEDDKYYLSSIDDLNEWKAIDDENVVKKKNITDELNQMMEEYKVFSNVNFLNTQKNTQ